MICGILENSDLFSKSLILMSILSLKTNFTSHREEALFREQRKETESWPNVPKRETEMTLTVSRGFFFF
jgi:hypothetical protein